MRATILKHCIRLLTVLLTAGCQPLFGQLVTNTTTLSIYSTIQAAIDDPLTLNGHTLSLTAGAYYENVLVNKEISIIGPNSGTDGNSTRGPEAIIYPPAIWYGDGTYNGGYLIRVTADNVTIDGLTLNGDNPAFVGGYSTNHGDFDMDFGILCYWSPWYEYPFTGPEDYNSAGDLAGDNLKIKNNIFRNFKWHAIYMQSDYHNPVPKAGEILNNKIQNVAGHAIFLLQNYYANIEYNTIENSIYGLTVYFYWLAKPFGSTGNIKNNTINSATIETNWDVPTTGVQGFTYHFIYGFADPWTISNNTLTNATPGSAESSGIGIYIDWTSDPVHVSNNNITGFENGYRLATSSNPDVPNSSIIPTTVTGGSLSNNTYGVTASNFNYNGNHGAYPSVFNVNGVTILNSTAAGVFVDDNATSLTHATVAVNVTNCKINGGPVGILLNGGPCSATAHDNDLSGNSSFAINNLSPNNADATCNWYGHGSGPLHNTTNPGGSGSAVSDNVTFFPWLINGTDNDPAQGFQPAPGSCCTLTLTCPGNIQGNILLLCRGIASTPNPVIIVSGSCNLTKLTWNMTGATTGSSPASGIHYVGTKIFNNGITTITYTATNNAGYSTSCSFTVTMVDNSSPFIFCPFNITTNAPGNSCSRTINVANPIVFDNCGVTKLTWVMTGATTGSSPSTGINYVGTRTFNVGTTTVTYTARDAANNATSCSFTVRVNGSQNCNNRQSGEITDRHLKGITNDKLEINVYPNPSESYFTLEILSGSSEKIEISVFDATGRMLKRMNAVPERSIRFGDDLKPGIYMIEVKQGPNREVVKVIKQ